MGGRRPGRIGALLVVRWREHDEDTAFLVVVRREDVGDRPGGQIALGVHLDGLALHAHLPLERGANVIVPVVEPQPEDVVHRASESQAKNAAFGAG